MDRMYCGVFGFSSISFRTVAVLIESQRWSVEKSRMVAQRERDQLARFLRDRGFDLG